MKRFLAASIALLGLTLPAQATEWLDCSGGEDISFRVLLGAMDVIAVNTIEIEVKDQKWSTARGDGVTSITTGQAFETPDQMWIDVTDEDVNLVVARLRLFKAFEAGAEGVDPSDAKGGTLQMPGIGAWAVSCSGP